MVDPEKKMHLRGDSTSIPFSVLRIKHLEMKHFPNKNEDPR